MGLHGGVDFVVVKKQRHGARVLAGRCGRRPLDGPSRDVGMSELGVGSSWGVKRDACRDAGGSHLHNPVRDKVG